MPQGFHFLTLTQRHEMRAAKAPITEPSASVVKKTTMSSTLRSPALMEPFLGFAAFGIADPESVIYPCIRQVNVCNRSTCK